MNSKVLFSPFDKQNQFIEAVFSGKYSLLCYGGAMGGGKSYVCLAVLIMLCRVYPKSKWCVIRESIPTLKRTTLETFKKVVPTNFIASINQQDHTYTFKNGSQIIFMAEDYANDKELDRFKGLEVNGFLLEQIEELQEDLLSICFIRAGRHKIDKMPHPLILANINPTLRWPRKRIYEPFVFKTLKSDWFYLAATIKDNPVLYEDAQYMHNLTSNLDDVTKGMLIDGDWDSFPTDNLYLYKFDRKKHVIRSSDYTPNPHLNIQISFDFNKEPMTCGISQKPEIGKYVRFNEFTMPAGSTPELCDRIIAEYPQWMDKIDVTGDASGRNRTPMLKGNVTHYTIIRDKLNLNDYNLKVETKNPELSASRITCNSILQNATVMITDNCTDTIADIANAKVDENGNLIKTQQIGLHHFDNFRYDLEASFPGFIKHPEWYQ